MKNTVNILHLLGIAALLIGASCTPKKTTPPVDTGLAALHVTNMAGNQQLNITTGPFVNTNGDTVTISLFRYYVSNIVLNGATNYTESNSYHLLKQDDPTSLNIILNSIPVGSYTGITYLIGVDSIRNVSGAQTGALDPLNGMFWAWNTGYIMAKLEGTSPSANTPGHKFAFHIGGFSGPNNAVKTVTLTFPSPLVITKSNTSNIYLHADAHKWFSPNTIRTAVTDDIAVSCDTAGMIAKNYAQMFGADSVKN